MAIRFMYPGETVLRPMYQQTALGVQFPVVCRQWIVYFDFRCDTLERVYRAASPGPSNAKHTIGPCETPEALAGALALIDPTLED